MCQSFLCRICAVALFVWFVIPPALAEYDFSSSIGITPKSEVNFKIRGVYEPLPPGGYFPVRIEIVNKTDKPLKWDIAWSTRAYNGSMMTMRGRLGAAAEDTSTSVWLVPGIAAPSSGSLGGNLNFNLTGPFVERGSASQYSGNSATVSEPFAIISGFPASWWISVEDILKQSDGQSLQTTQFSPNQMVPDWRALAGFSAVVVRDVEWMRLGVEKRNVLLQYVAQGGRLIVCSPKDTVADLPTGKIGFGEAEIFVLGDEEILRMATAIGKLASAPLRRVADGYPSDWELGLALRRFPAPHMVIVGLMILFGLLIGPVNFFVLAKEGSRHRLFFTTPLIALAATVLMFLFIIIRDGFGGEGRRFLAAVSLPELRSLSIVQEQVSRTGLLPGSGFVLDPDSLIQPVILKRDSGLPTGPTRGLTYTFHGSHLDGDWFRSRSVQAQYLATQVSSRSRVEVFEKEGAPPEAQSYFENPMGTFFYRDGGGRVWTAPSLGTGERVVLAKARGQEFSKWWNETTAKAGPWLRERLRIAGMEKGSFFAEAEAGPLIPTLTAIDWRDDQVVFVGRVVRNP